VLKLWYPSTSSVRRDKFSTARQAHSLPVLPLPVLPLPVPPLPVPEPVEGCRDGIQCLSFGTLRQAQGPSLFYFFQGPSHFSFLGTRSFWFFQGSSLFGFFRDKVILFFQGPSLFFRDLNSAWSWSSIPYGHSGTFTLFRSLSLSKGAGMEHCA